MSDDPIIEELHRVREEIAAKFNYDVHALFAYWRAREAEEGRKVVSFEVPKKDVQVDEEEMQDLAA
jgi:hypothetical protein